VIVATTAGTAAAVAIGVVGSWDYAPSVGWDCAATVFLVWTWTAIGRMDAEQTASHATEDDPSKRVTQLLVLSTSVASLFGVGVSDTELNTHIIRATVLRHALLSYLFGSLILASTVNLIVSLASSNN